MEMQSREATAAVAVSSLISPATVLPALAGGDRDFVLAQLVEAVSIQSGVSKGDAADIYDLVLAREQLGTTGIGRGIAVPHAKHLSISSPVAAVGISGCGIEYQSLDGEPVHIVFMVISPADQPASHLQALQSVSLLLQDDLTRRMLAQATTEDEILEIISEVENR